MPLAEAYAINQLGIQAVYVNNIKAANYWNYGLLQARRAKMPLPKQIVAREFNNEFSSVPALAGPVENSQDYVLQLNTGFDWENLPSWTVKKHSTGGISTNDIEHVLWNAMGNIKNADANPKSYEGLSKSLKNDGPFLQKKWARLISEKASMHPLDFVAEVFVMEKFGRRLNKRYVLEDYHNQITLRSNGYNIERMKQDQGYWEKSEKELIEEIMKHYRMVRYF